MYAALLLFHVGKDQTGHGATAGRKRLTAKW
jgi:hypothetical protein